MYFIIFKDRDREGIIKRIKNETEVDIKIDMNRERINERFIDKVE
jgi:hypothetical protein